MALRASEKEEYEKAEYFLNGLISDIDYTCMHDAMIMSHFEDIMSGEDNYRYLSDKFLLRMQQPTISEYKSNILVHPGVVHRARTFFSHINDIFEQLSTAETPSITRGGRRVLVEYLVYGLSLAVGLSTHNGAMRNYQEISSEEIFARFRSFSFAGAGAALQPNEFEALVRIVRES